MRHKIITAACKPRQFKIFLKHRNPLVGIHGKLYKPFFRDICAGEGFAQIVGGFFLLWHGDFQQMAENRFPVCIVGVVMIAVTALQRIFTQGSQYLDHIVNAIDDLDILNLWGKRRGLFAALKFHCQHHRQYFLIECVGKDHFRHFLTDRIETIFAVHRLNPVWSEKGIQSLRPGFAGGYGPFLFHSADGF